MKAFDFTTYERDLSLLTPANLAALKDQGFQHAIVGMDSAPASIAAVRALLDAGFTWDSYRFLYSYRDVTADIDDLRAGIIGVYQTRTMLRDLPGVAWLDIEQDDHGAFPSQQQCLDAWAQLLRWQIGPSYVVQGGVYSGAWVWQAADWGNWSELAQAGALLWTNAQQPAWGGWTDTQLAGFQTAENQDSPIGPIDVSTMRDRTIALLKQPF